ncbi:MAG: hypothetical protein II574_11085 [Ruminococcus sp.]|nr:hypothetical protein [Ruminococcus sp.]
MKKRILSALAAVCLACSLATSCASSSSQSDASSASSSSAAESSSAADSSSSADSSKSDSSSEAVPKYDYVHGTDGYFNLLDECPNFKLKTQQSGTCWLYAGRASIQTVYEKQTGKELKMEIPDMLNIIYGDNMQEGFCLNPGINKGEFGGWQTMISSTLSRGFKDGIVLDSSVIIDPTDREAIKNVLRTRGAVAAETYDNAQGKGSFGSYFTVNYSLPDEYDHDVAIIGYDDHFPKEYFINPASQDGAWIVYNSNMGDMLCYISYDSPFGYTLSHTATDKYSDVLSYDAGNEMDRYVSTGDSTKVANVFHKKGKLAAVGTFNVFDEQNIKIEIMSADFKTVLYSQDAKLDYKGYHTVELTKPVDVEDYAVVITYPKGASVEGDDLSIEEGSYKTIVEKGQSFVFVGGKWKDVTDSDIKSVLKTDFEPRNCCIKALYTK